ncbi:MAG: AAA family ATPase [Thermomicrobiales bacterium]
MGNWEQELGPDEPPTVPQVNSLRLVAEVFGFGEGSPEYRDLFQARIEAETMRRERKQQRDAATRFVVAGRDAELERLVAGIGRAASGQPEVLFVRGMAGMGKTWLVHEACRQMVERRKRLAVIWGQSTSLCGPADLYQPFDEAIQRLLHPDRERLVLPRDISETNRDRLLARAKKRGPFDDRTRVGDASHRASRIVQTLLATMQGPLVLVLDDLHWADDATAATLYHLVREIEGSAMPLAIVATYRPSALAQRQSGGLGAIGGTAVPSVIREVIRRYPDALIDLQKTIAPGRREAFVDAMLSQRKLNLSQEDRASLIRFSQGVPFYVEAWLRYRSMHPAMGGPDAVDLPPEINAVLAEQVSALPKPARPLLRLASAQGESFWAEAAGGVLGLEPEELGHMLDKVLDRDHGLVTGDRREAVAGVMLHRYRFQHALFADFVRERMSPLEQTRMHAATADAMTVLLGSGPHTFSHDCSASGRGRAS